MIDIDQWKNILSKIFNKEINIIKDYETKNKSIGSVYHKFKVNYKLPFQYFLLLNECSHLKYYYTDEERKIYFEKWINRIDNSSINPFSKIEYDFYLKISIENKFYNKFIHLNHYMDNGCLCRFCSKKRKEILSKIKKGENISNEKIIHNADLIKKELIENRLSYVKKKIGVIEHNSKLKNTLNYLIQSPN